MQNTNIHKHEELYIEFCKFIKICKLGIKIDKNFKECAIKISFNIFKKNFINNSKFIKIINNYNNYIIKHFIRNLLQFRINNYNINHLNSLITTTEDSIYNTEDSNFNEYKDITRKIYTKKNCIKIHYKGQNKGKFDKYLKKNSILVYRKTSQNPLKILGIITSVIKISNNINGIPAIYELKIITNIKINNINCNIPIRNDYNKFRGTGCFKKTVCNKLGYKIIGRLGDGITQIQKISI